MVPRFFERRPIKTFPDACARNFQASTFIKSATTITTPGQFYSVDKGTRGRDAASFPPPSRRFQRCLEFSFHCQLFFRKFGRRQEVQEFYPMLCVFSRVIVERFITYGNAMTLKLHRAEKVCINVR